MRKRKLLVLLALALTGAAAPSVQASDWSSEWPKVECSRGQQPYNGAFRVKALQYLLRDAGYKIATDGRFGKQTEDAVRSFQRRRGFKVTGKVGNTEWEALTPTLRRGDKSDAVRALQVTLNNFIHEHTGGKSRPMPVDGSFGSTTQKFVRQAQDDPDHEPDGVADGFTWFTLLFDEH